MKAVVFIDVQNDFLKGGILGYSYPKENLNEKLIQFAKECRNKGYMLYATADTHYAFDKGVWDTHRGLRDYLTGTLEGKLLPVEHCIDGTDGHKILEGLVKDENRNVVIPQGHIIDKPTFGSFDLLARIDRDFGVDTYGKQTQQSKSDGIGEDLDEIIICGFYTAICILANAVLLRAKYPNLKITVRADLCGDVDETSHNAALKVLSMQQIDVVNS